MIEEEDFVKTGVSRSGQIIFFYVSFVVHIFFYIVVWNYILIKDGDK